MSDRDGPGRGRLKPQHAPAEGGLAGSRLADDPQAAAAHHVEADTVEGPACRLALDPATPGTEMLADVLDPQQAGRRRSLRVVAGASWSRSSIGVGLLCQPGVHPQVCEPFVQRQLGGQQTLRVSLSRSAFQLVRSRHLDYAALRHDQQSVCHRHRDPKVVSDHQQSHPVRSLESPDQLQHLSLGGRVQRRRRFIRDQQPWLPDDRRCEPHALSHTTRQLPRVLLAGRSVDPDLRETRGDVLTDLCPRRGPAAYRLAHRGPHPGKGIQEREGVLQQHADARPPNRSQLAFAQLQQLCVVAANRASCLQPAREQAGNRLSGQGLARSGLAH